MNNRRKGLIQLAILGVLGLGVILTLVLPELPTMGKTSEIVEISVFVQEGEMTLYSSARLGMEAAAVDWGAELRFITPNQWDDHEAQVESLLREVEGGAQAIVIAPVNSEALASVLETIKIPVVTMESEVDGSYQFVSPDNEMVGIQLAEAVIADVAEGETVLLLDTIGEREGIRQRMDSCVETLEQSGLQVVIVTVAEAEMLARSSAAVVALEDETTLLMAEWQSKEGSTTPLYGVGSTTTIAAYLEQGVLRATVAWSDYALGYMAVRQGAQLASQKTVETIQTYTITTIRGETLYDPENQKLLFPVV